MFDFGKNKKYLKILFPAISGGLIFTYYNWLKTLVYKLINIYSGAYIMPQSIIEKGSPRQEEFVVRFIEIWVKEGILIGICIPTVLVILISIFNKFIPIKNENERPLLANYVKRVCLRLNFFQWGHIIYRLLLVSMVLIVFQLAIAYKYAFSIVLLYPLLWAFIGYCFMIEGRHISKNWCSENKAVHYIDERLKLKQGLVTCFYSSGPCSGLEEYLNDKVVNALCANPVERVFPFRLPYFARKSMAVQLGLIVMVAFIFTVNLPDMVSSYVGVPASLPPSTGGDMVESVEPRGIFHKQLSQESKEINQLAKQLAQMAKKDQKGAGKAAEGLRKLGLELAMLSASASSLEDDRKMAKMNLNTGQNSETKTNSKLYKEFLQNNPQIVSNLIQNYKNDNVKEGMKDWDKAPQKKYDENFLKALDEYYNNPHSTQQPAPTKGHQPPKNSPGNKPQALEAPVAPPSKTAAPKESAEELAKQLKDVMQQLEKWQEELVKKSHENEIAQQESQEEDPFDETDGLSGENNRASKNQSQDTSKVFSGRSGSSGRDAKIIRGNRDRAPENETDEWKIRVSGDSNDPHHKKVVNLSPDPDKSVTPKSSDNERAAVLGKVQLNGNSPAQNISKIDTVKGKLENKNPDLNRRQGLLGLNTGGSLEKNYTVRDSAASGGNFSKGDGEAKGHSASGNDSDFGGVPKKSVSKSDSDDEELKKFIESNMQGGNSQKKIENLDPETQKIMRQMIAGMKDYERQKKGKLGLGLGDSDAQEAHMQAKESSEDATDKLLKSLKSLQEQKSGESKNSKKTLSYHQGSMGESDKYGSQTEEFKAKMAQNIMEAKAAGTVKNNSEKYKTANQEKRLNPQGDQFDQMKGNSDRLQKNQRNLPEIDSQTAGIYKNSGKIEGSNNNTAETKFKSKVLQKAVLDDVPERVAGYEKSRDKYEDGGDEKEKFLGLSKHKSSKEAGKDKLGKKDKEEQNSLLKEAYMQIQQNKNQLSQLAQELDSSSSKLEESKQGQLREAQKNELTQLSQRLDKLTAIIPQAKDLSIKVKKIADKLEKTTADSTSTLRLNDDKNLKKMSQELNQTNYTHKQESIRDLAVAKIDNFIDQINKMNSQNAKFSASQKSENLGAGIASKTPLSSIRTLGADGKTGTPYPKADNLSNNEMFNKIVTRLHAVRNRLESETADAPLARISAPSNIRNTASTKQPQNLPDRQALTPAEKNYTRAKSQERPKSKMPQNTLVSFNNGNEADGDWKEISVQDEAGVDGDFTTKKIQTQISSAKLSNSASDIQSTVCQAVPMVYEPIIKKLFSDKF